MKLFSLFSLFLILSSSLSLSFSISSLTSPSSSSSSSLSSSHYSFPSLSHYSSSSSISSHYSSLSFSSSDIIYSFDSNCYNSGLMYQTFYSCILKNSAYILNGNVILEGSSYVSMDYSITMLFGSNKVFTIELFGVSTGTYQSPTGSELFRLSSSNNLNYINLYDNSYGYLSIGIQIAGIFYKVSSTTSFHSSSPRNYAVTIDLTNLQVILYIAGIQASVINLPSTANKFSQSITSGSLNGLYDDPSYQLTHVSISEVHLNSEVLSASEILQNHRTYLTQTNSPTSSPTLYPTRTPTILTSRPTRMPIISQSPTASDTYSPSTVPEKSSVDDTKQSTGSNTTNSAVIIAPIILILFLLSLCCFYHYCYNNESSTTKINFSSILYSFQDLLPRSYNSRPSLYQLTTQTKLNQIRNHLLPSGYCIICSSNVSHVYKLPCNHSICLDDLKAYLHAALGNSALFPLRCPMHCNGCTEVISLNIPQRFLSYEDYIKFLNLHDRATYGDGVRCIRCQHYIPLPDSTTNKIYMIACPNCTIVFCLQCKLTSHNNKKCPVDIETEQFEGWVESAGAMKCPGCKKLIEKEDPTTCNHMCHKNTDPIPCIRERTDFCYCCGEEVLATHPHDEVKSPGVNHFPQGVFQKCRVVLEREAQIKRQERQREDESLWNLTTTHIRPQTINNTNRNRSSAAVVPYE